MTRRARDSGSAPPTTFEPDTESDTGRVLLVGEHLSPMASVLESRLDSYGVVVESDDDMALARLATEPNVACVVAEHDPPTFDGVAFLRSVRDRFPGLPCILYATDIDGAVVEEALDTGVTDVVDSAEEFSEILAVRRVRNLLASVRDSESTAVSERASTQSVSTPATIVTFGVTGEILRAHNTERVFGADSGSLVGESFSALFPEATPDRLSSLSNDAVGTTHRLTGERRDGSYLALSVTVVGVEEETVTCLVRSVDHGLSLTEFTAFALDDPETEDLLEAAACLVVSELDLSYVTVLQCDVPGRTCTLRASVGLSDVGVADERIDVRHGTPAAHASPSLDPIFASDFEAETQFDGPSVETETAADATAGFVVSFPWQRGSVGLVEGYVPTTRTFTESEREFVRTVASLLSFALDSEGRRIGEMRTFERSSDAVCVLDEELRVTHVNERAASMLAHDPSEILGERFFDSFTTRDGRALEDVFVDVLESGDSTDTEAYSPALERWYDVRLDAVDDGVGLELDATGDRDVSEQTLWILQDVVQRLADVTSIDAVRDIVVAAARVLLPTDRTTMFLFDDETNVLRPASDDIAAVGPSDDSPTWNAFVGGETAAAVDEDETGLVVSPVGRYGVLVVELSASVDDRAERLVRLLADVSEQAVERLSLEQTLRERERELEQQAHRLERFNQTTQTLLSVEKAITHANSLEELEAAVCDELVKSERCSFAWIGRLDDANDGLAPSSWSGVERGYFERADLSLSADNSEPAIRAAWNRRTVHVENVSHGLRGEAWRQELLNRGIQSVLSLPLVYDDALYGVLTVCASTPDAFDDLSKSVFDEIADSTAYGIDAIESKRALATDSVVELDVRISDSTDVFRRLAQHVDGTLTFEGYVPKPDMTSMLYVTISNASTDAVFEFLEDSVGIADVEHVSDVENRQLFVVTASEPTIVSWVTNAEAAIQELRATPTETRLVVELPRPTNVRGFLESLQEKYPNAELLGRRSLERPIESRQTFMASLAESLTERQLEVLETAYLNGYFEWPRARTGEEIAELLGITQPTFNNHLRVAERKLFTMLFETEQSDRKRR